MTKNILFLSYKFLCPYEFNYLNQVRDVWKIILKKRLCDIVIDAIFIEFLSHVPLNCSPSNTCDIVCENGLVLKFQETEL